MFTTKVVDCEVSTKSLNGTGLVMSEVDTSNNSPDFNPIRVVGG